MIREFPPAERRHQKNADLDDRISNASLFIAELRVPDYGKVVTFPSNIQRGSKNDIIPKRDNYFSHIGLLDFLFISHTNKT